ncbi:MAG: hypothetical protein M1383_02175 [Patescibacteria group bacterium]|nr:hypothetical protein [Patescibacteria group bacterium]
MSDAPASPIEDISSPKLLNNELLKYFLPTTKVIKGSTDMLTSKHDRPEKKTQHIRMDKDLQRQLKIYAAEHSTNMTKLLNSFVKKILHGGGSNEELEEELKARDRSLREFLAKGKPFGDSKFIYVRIYAHQAYNVKKVLQQAGYVPTLPHKHLDHFTTVKGKIWLLKDNPYPNLHPP